MPSIVLAPRDTKFQIGKVPAVIELILVEEDKQW